MVYTEAQNQSVSFLRGGALKWTTTWPNAFIFSLTYPKFIMNLSPFLRKKSKISCIGVGCFSTSDRNVKMPQLT